MSEQILDLLKLCLLALLYLFFLRVLWAVATQLRTPAVIDSGRGGGAAPARSRRSRPKRSQRPSGRAPRQLVVHAPPELAGTQFDLVDQFTFGRAAGCGMVLDDTYVSQTHGRIYRGEDGWYFEDLGSTNGSIHNGTKVSAPVRLTRGDQIRMGGAELEVR